MAQSRCYEIEKNYSFKWLKFISKEEKPFLKLPKDQLKYS